MKLILFAMFVLRSMVAYSQASHIEMANNEMKYWKLRGRLIHLFDMFHNSPVRHL
jgi:hypothetical protein